MTMKATRHAKILELIQNHTVTTQEELQSLLEANGFYATQATISRDIRDLRLVKVLSPSGIYYYTQSNTAPADTLQLSGDSVFMRSIRSVDCAGNIVVIKTIARRSLAPSQGRTPSLFCLRPSILPMNSAPICGSS